jgi:two-component sensor histidine kinase
VWSESGGPPVAEPKWRGFGSHLIEQNLARSRCRMAIRASNLARRR